MNDQPGAVVGTDAISDFSEMVELTKFDMLDRATVEAARFSLLDTLGCAIAGRNAAGVAAVRDLIADRGGRADSLIWGTGLSVPADSAAFANAVSGHALDYDDQHPGVLHTGVCVVPAAIAECEASGVTSMERLLETIVVATEVADRLAVATTVGPGVSGWLLTPLCGYFGAAAAASKVRGLSGQEIRNALGFAYVQASGNGQSTLDGALAKRMQPGFAARGGVFAAELAARGLTAPWNSLEGPRGFFRVYHQDKYSPAALRDNLGKRWLISEATFKPYPCCAWTHAALECGFALREETRPADIASVTIGVNAQAYKSTGTPLPRRYRPRTEVDAQFSIPYMFALAMVNGAIALNDFTDWALSREEIAALAERVTVRVDDGLDALYGRQVSPARAVATLTDGSSRESVVLEPSGTGNRLMGHADLLAKFRACCAHGSSPEGISDRIPELVLEGRGEVAAGLFDALRGPW